MSGPLAELAQILATPGWFRPLAFDGVGVTAGPLRPDWGPAYAELECDACAATWVGVPGESCTWCQLSHERVLEHQAELVLRPPQDRSARALTAWADRLAVAVDAGIIGERQARRVLERETHVLGS